MVRFSDFWKNTEYRDKTAEVIYLIYFGLMVGARASGLYEGMLIYNITLVIGMLLFGLKMIVGKHTLKEYLLAGFFVLLSVIVYLHTGEKGLLVCFSMMLGMKNVSVKKAIKVGACVGGFFIISKIILGVFRVTSEIYYPQWRSGMDIMFRHALGYPHPNSLHMNVAMLGMMTSYLVTSILPSKKINGTNSNISNKNHGSTLIMIMLSLLILAFNYYVYLYSGSRTGLLGCLFYLIINTWLFFRKKIGIIEKIILYSFFPIVCVVAIILPLILKGRLYNWLNWNVFSTRFEIARYFWANNSISLFGIRLNNPDPLFRTYGIDMAQLYLFLQLGLVAFVTISALTMWFIHNAVINDKRAELAVLMGTLFLGIWEPFLYNLSYKNFVFVFFGAMIYRLGTKKDIIKSNTYDKDILKLSSRLLIIVAIGSIVGLVAACGYANVSPKPSALYGDRQESESGELFGMEEYYLTKSQVAELKGQGDIFIGYKDETSPMYKYDSELALMEYKKYVVSFGVWMGVGVCIVLILICRSVRMLRRKTGDIQLCG